MKPKIELIVFLSVSIGWGLIVLLYNGWEYWHDVRIWFYIAGGIAIFGTIYHFVDRWNLKRKS